MVGRVGARQGDGVTEDETRWPLDPSDSPVIFRPQGYLVAILPALDEGQRARTSLEAAGYLPENLRLYSAEEILSNYDLWVERRSVLGKIVGPLTDDLEGRDLYHDYAREGRSALWTRIPKEEDVAKALRVLADYHPLHTRYYGDNRQDDVHFS